MGNGWFGRAVMPLMACLVRAFVNRASPWGLAGFDVVGVAPKISARYVDRGCGQKPGMWISSAFRYPGHRFMGREGAASTLGFGVKMCSRMRCKVLEAPASAAHAAN